MQSYRLVQYAIGSNPSCRVVAWRCASNNSTVPSTTYLPTFPALQAGPACSSRHPFSIGAIIQRQPLMVQGLAGREQGGQGEVVQVWRRGVLCLWRDQQH